jgi:hypothetical protein
VAEISKIAKPADIKLMFQFNFNSDIRIILQEAQRASNRRILLSFGFNAPQLAAKNIPIPL